MGPHCSCKSRPRCLFSSVLFYAGWGASASAMRGEEVLNYRLVIVHTRETIAGEPPSVRSVRKPPIPAAPCGVMVITWALQGLACHHFGVCLHIIKLHGALGMFQLEKCGYGVKVEPTTAHTNLPRSPPVGCAAPLVKDTVGASIITNSCSDPLFLKWPWYHIPETCLNMVGNYSVPCSTVSGFR